MKRWRLGLVLLLCTLCCACTAGEQTLEPLAGWDIAPTTSEADLVWYFGTNMSADMVGAIQAAYAAECGMQIEWINAEENNLKKVFASGREPDVIALAAYDIKGWKERLLDLSGESWVEDVFGSSLAAATFDGKLCAMPITYEACGILYNKALFEQAGIHSLPQTIGELESVCNALSEQGIQPFGECYQLPGFAGHTFSVLFAYEPSREQFVQRLESGDASIADMRYYGDWLELFDLMSEYGFGEKSAYYSIDDQIADFATGRMAMIKQGTWLERLVKQVNPDASMGLMAIPCTQNSEDCKLMVTTTNFVGVNKETQNVDKAVAFLNWLHQNADRFFGEMEGATLCYYSSEEEYNALSEDVAAYVKAGKSFDSFGSEGWPVAYDNDILRIFQQYLTGAIKREEVAEQLTQSYLLRLE